LNFSQLKRLFERPPEGYGPVPFWAVNASMELEEIKRSLEDLRDKGIEEVIIHPRSGLEVEYLSDEYWHGMDVIVSELVRLGMKGWIYDEYNWPSGVAGGKLLRERSEFRQISLNHMTWRHGKSVELRGPLVAAFDMDRDFEPVDGQEGVETFIPPHGMGSYLLFRQERVTDRTFATSSAPWAQSELGVLDYLNPEAVDFFIELTHRQYEKRYSEHFGKTLLGVFTDEPQNYRGLPWCADMPEQFKKRAGYDLGPVLYHLAADAPGAVRTRCDFYRTAGELFKERYYEVLGKWCSERGLIFTGHLGMEEFLSLLAANHGSLYLPLSAMQMPGIDMLGIGHGFSKGVVHSEAPNLAPKVVSSIAGLHARRRCLVELWGGGGWAATPARLKKSLDWMFATGVNFINPHLTWVSAKGLRKRDFPQSFSNQQPWWSAFGPFSEYISRLSAVLSEGVHRARVLLLFPTAGLWAASKGRGRMSPQLDATVKSVAQLTDRLLLGGHDFNYLFEEAIELYGIEDGKIRAGEGRFDAVVVPNTVCLMQSTIEFLKKASEVGVVVACDGQAPRFDDKGEDTRSELKAVFNPVADGRDTVGKIIDWLDDKVPPRVRVSSARDRTVLSHHRRVDNTDMVFVTELTPGGNSFAEPVVLRLRGMAGRTPHLWNPEDGSEVKHVDAVPDGDDIVLKLKLGPGRSMVVAVPPESEPKVIEVEKSAKSTNRKILQLDNWAGVPLGPNVYLIEPCVIRVLRRPARTLDRLRRDRRFPYRAKLAAVLARGAIAVSRLVARPERRYRYERFFNFEKAMGMLDTAERALGIPFRQLGPYEAADLIDEWAQYLDLPPGMGKAFPAPGSGYRLETKVKFDFIPKDVGLVYEDLGEPVSICVNDRFINRNESFYLWDESNRIASLAGIIHRGINTITFESRLPDFDTLYPTVHAPEPLALVGSFSVKGEHICAPEDISGPLESWTSEGLPYYFGPVSYRCTVKITADSLSEAILDMGDVREVAEARINGNEAGVRLWPPYQIDAMRFLKNGENDIEVVVRNTAANFFARPKTSGLLGPTKLILDYR